MNKVKVLLELTTLRLLPMAAPPDGPLEKTQEVLERLVRSQDAVRRDGIYQRTAKGDARLKGPRTPCCQKLLLGLGEDPTRSAVRWNPDNGVVQCHACGEIYVPACASSDRRGRGDGDFAYNLWKQADGGLK